MINGPHGPARRRGTAHGDTAQMVVDQGGDGSLTASFAAQLGGEAAIRATQHSSAAPETARPAVVTVGLPEPAGGAAVSRRSRRRSVE